MIRGFMDSPTWRLADLAADLDRMVGDLMHEGRAWPELDIEETDGALVMTVDLPGVGREAISLEVDGRQLVLRGEKPAPAEAEGETLLHGERRYGGFERTFALGTFVDREQVSAEFRDGVLTIRLPLAEAARPRRIEVTG